MSKNRSGDGVGFDSVDLLGGVGGDYFGGIGVVAVEEEGGGAAVAGGGPGGGDEEAAFGAVEGGGAFLGDGDAAGNFGEDLVGEFQRGDGVFVDTGVGVEAGVAGDAGAGRVEEGVEEGFV